MREFLQHTGLSEVTKQRLRLSVQGEKQHLLIDWQKHCEQKERQYLSAQQPT